MINPRKISIPQDSVVGGATETSDVDSFVGMLQESNTARKEMKTVLHEILRQPDTIEEMQLKHSGQNLGSQCGQVPCSFLVLLSLRL